MEQEISGISKFPEKRTTSRGEPKFWKRISGKFLFHSILNRDFRKFWSNGTRPTSADEVSSSWQTSRSYNLETVVHKSHRSEGQPRSTRSEFPSRGVFANRRLFQYGGLYFHINMRIAGGKTMLFNKTSTLLFS